MERHRRTLHDDSEEVESSSGDEEMSEDEKKYASDDADGSQLGNNSDDDEITHKESPFEPLLHEAYRTHDEEKQDLILHYENKGLNEEEAIT